MARFARALPAIARTLARLVRDPALPRSVKIAIAAALVYLLSPFDLIPDFVPLAGYLDDVLVGAVVVDGVLSAVDRDVLLRYWPGSPEALDRIGRVAHFLARWVPRRLRRRFFRVGPGR